MTQFIIPADALAAMPDQFGWDNNFGNSRPPSRKRASIPPSVYYNAEHDNFYDAKTRRGMGHCFYVDWLARASEFPTAPSLTATKPTEQGNA